MSVFINKGDLAVRSRWWLERFPFLLGIGLCLFQLVLSWNAPITEQYALRQAQTAFSAFWLLNGGEWLGYQTPIFGAPWSTPFELPFYQWLVALTKQLVVPLTLDQAGRVVSMLFTFACLWPLRRLTRHLPNGIRHFYVVGALLLLSPIYAFWARSFMIESTALFFSMWFLAALVDYLDSNQSAVGWMEMTFVSVLGALIKVTTFVGFSLAGLAVLCVYVIHLLRKGAARDAIKALLSVGMSLLISLVVLWFWVRYADGLKSLNSLAAMFTSKSLERWNFGTLSQRVSIDLLDVLAVRGPNEALGSFLVPLVVLACAFFKLDRTKIIICTALLALYLAPLIIFVNLHLVHHYYQLANDIFLIAAVGYAIVSLDEVSPGVLLPLLVVSAAACLYGYGKYYFDDEVLGSREHEMILARYLRQNVPANGVFMGFGLELSSEVPYYAARRAILVPNRTKGITLKDIQDHLDVYLDGYRLSAVVVCPNRLESDEAKMSQYRSLLANVVRDRKPQVVGYCLIYR